MRTRLSILRGFTAVSLVVLLVACAGSRQHAARGPQEQRLTSPEAAASPVSSFRTVDDYKLHAARNVLRDNVKHTFSGKLPPMLPAIVVLRITVAENGSISKVVVQRPPAKDDGETAIALASIRRTMLPRPYNLARERGRTLSYSETFLFNADMRFQLRTLAPIQTSD